jgi:hypothetical protein
MIARALAGADAVLLTNSAVSDRRSPSSRRRPGPKNSGLWNMDPGLRRDDGRSDFGTGSFLEWVVALLKGTSR